MPGRRSRVDEVVGAALRTGPDVEETGSWPCPGGYRPPHGPAAPTEVGAGPSSFSPRAAIAAGPPTLSATGAWPRALPVLYLLSLAAATVWKCAVLGGASAIWLVGFDALALLILAVGTGLEALALSRPRRQFAGARQLGPYRLRRRLGAGAMGEVYLAEHQLLKRVVP